ncbi:serine/threonine protein kinase [Streptomyces acidicola]|uniref:serine/threonine protein kinase n=1 Tax=Streptomyces acidicola TaxID=2596892 RepID=UPI00342BC1E6
MKTGTIGAGITGAMLVVAASLNTTGTAAAAAAATSPTSLCGSGYTVRASNPLGDVPSADVYLLRNGSSACVATIKRDPANLSVEIGAWVDNGGGRNLHGASTYNYGVAVHMSNDDCVNWGGWYGGASYSNTPCP